MPEEENNSLDNETTENSEAKDPGQEVPFPGGGQATDNVEAETAEAATQVVAEGAGDGSSSDVVESQEEGFVVQPEQTGTETPEQVYNQPEPSVVEQQVEQAQGAPVSEVVQQTQQAVEEVRQPSVSPAGPASSSPKKASRIIGALIGAFRDKKKRPLALAAAGLVLVVIIAIIVSASTGKKPTPVTPPIVTTPSPAMGSAPFTVNFDAKGLGSDIVYFTWDFGDSKSGTGNPVTYTYTKVGNFTAKVVGEKQDGTKVQAAARVIINNVLPLPEVTADVTSGDAPLTVNFDASNSKDPNGTITGYEWIWNDPLSPEAKSQSVKASHSFTQQGIYEVELKVTDNNNETASKKITISVGQEGSPKAVISSTPELLEGLAPLTAKLSGTQSSDSDGSIQKYEWDFGDGSPKEQGQTANHTYKTSGKYTMSLEVTDDKGLKGRDQKEVRVLEENEQPKATITTDPEKPEGQVPLKINFDGGQSSDPDGNIVSFSWVFGDKSEPETGQSVEHTFEQPGKYKVELTVLDNSGNSAKKTLEVIAQSKEKTAPVVVISTDPDPVSIQPGGTVSFDASGSYDMDGSIISYKWDFGDKVIRLNGAQIAHQYTKAGVYTVKVEAYDNDGKKGTGTASVAVNYPNPVARISVNHKAGDAPLKIYFDAAESEGAIVSYYWDFADGTPTSTRKAPTHIFQNPGTYTVILKVTDTTGVVAETTETITVYGEVSG